MRHTFLGVFLLSSACVVAANQSGSWPTRNLTYLVDDLEARSFVFEYIENNDAAGLSNYLHKTQPRMGWHYVLNNLRNNSGLVAFHRAMVQTPKPNTFILGLLVYYGADPNLPLDQDIDRRRFRQGQFYAGWTAAHMAERSGLSDELKSFLTNLGCDFERKDTQGWTPAMVNQGRNYRKNKRQD